MILTMKLLALALELSSLTSASTTCYWTNGDLGTYLLPCQPSQPKSPCCGGTDYCTSSGLCINADGDNMYSIQGCTSKDWEQPCQSFCGPGTMRQRVETDTEDDKVRKMWQCQGVPSTKKMMYCCGESSACCSNTNDTFEVPVATEIYRPLGSSITSSNIGSQSTSSSTSTASPNSAQDSSSSLDADVDRLRKQGLGLALGLGIPLGLGMAAALVLFTCRYLKNRRAPKRDDGIAEFDATSENQIYGGSPMPPKVDNGSNSYKYMKATEPRELDNRNGIHEMGGI